jgi:hypothetical protein
VAKTTLERYGTLSTGTKKEFTGMKRMQRMKRIKAKNENCGPILR